jgi:hypothetical protein
VIHTSEQIRAELDSHPFDDGRRDIRVTVRKGESAWNPASTHSLIPGPAIVTYREHGDGGFDAIVDR